MFPIAVPVPLSFGEIPHSAPVVWTLVFWASQKLFLAGGTPHIDNLGLWCQPQPEFQQLY